MRTNETVRSRTLYHATLRKMLALGCAALLLLGSMLGSVVFMLTYQQPSIGQNRRRKRRRKHESLGCKH